MNGELSENSTFEMETKNNFDKILQAIRGMREDFAGRLDKIEGRLDKVETRLDKIEAEQTRFRADFEEFKNFTEARFEEIRQGIVKNYNQFDRLKSQIAENRSVIFSTKAAVGELNERVYLLIRANDLSLK